MTAKYEKQILKLATDRGWKFIRKGGHEQIIIEYPETGARMYLWASPRTRPSQTQVMTKLIGMERSSRVKDQSDILDWVCDRYGIPADGSKVVTDNLADIVREFLGREPRDKREGDRYKNALSHSPRVWLLGLGQRGAGAATPRLFLGKDAILSVEQLAEVRSWPQVNRVFDDLPSPTQRITEMESFALSRGFERMAGGYLRHKAKGLMKVSIPKAYELAQDMPEVPRVPEDAVATIPEAPPEPMAPPEPANVTTTGTEGIVVVDGEPGVHTTEWLKQNEEAAKTVGLPVELVAALREALKIDNSNTIAGLDLVHDSLNAAIDGASTLVKALEDLSTAIDLVKVEG